MLSGVSFEFYALMQPDLKFLFSIFGADIEKHTDLSLRKHSMNPMLPKVQNVEQWFEWLFIVGLVAVKWQKHFYGRRSYKERMANRVDGEKTILVRGQRTQSQTNTGKRKRRQDVWYERKVYPRFGWRLYVNFGFGIRVGAVPQESLNANLNDWDMINSMVKEAKKLKALMEKVDKHRVVKAGEEAFPVEVEEVNGKVRVNQKMKIVAKFDKNKNTERK